MEIWKDIVGYEGLYQVSNNGLVRSFYFGKIRILKPTINKSGYYQVSLKKDGVGKSHLVHRLVATSFIENNDNLPMVNHKDEDRLNNNVDNLEWCTNKYNVNYGNRNKKLSESLSKSVIGVNRISGHIIFSESIITLNKVGFDGSCISKCCIGKRETHKGYYWRYV